MSTTTNQTSNPATPAPAEIGRALSKTDEINGGRRGPCDGSAGKEADQAEEPEWKAIARSLTVDAQPKPPEEKLKELLGSNFKFADRWKGSSHGLKSRDQDSYDKSLGYYLIEADWTGQEITDSLAHKRAERRLPPRPPEYYVPETLADERSTTCQSGGLYERSKRV